MTALNEQIIKHFGNKLRVRVCGVCVENDKILLVRHRTLGDAGVLWAPPGGGMDFGANAEENLKREFLEETGYEIRIERFLFVHEYLQPPLHAVELFFEVQITGGELVTGRDPEMQQREQIIDEVRFVSFQEIVTNGYMYYHNIFTICKDLSNIHELKGYFIFGKKH